MGNNLQSNSKIRLHHQQGEVSFCANPSHSLAGVDLEQQEAHSFAASSVSEESEGFHHQVHQVQVHHPPTRKE